MFTIAIAPIQCLLSTWASCGLEVDTGANGACDNEADQNGGEEVARLAPLQVWRIPGKE